MPQVPAQSFPHHWSKLRPALVPSLATIAGGIAFLAAGEKVTLGWVSIASGVLMFVAFGLPLLLRVPMVAFDDRGLRARLPGFGRIAWTDIERVRLVRLREKGVALLVVDRTPAARKARPGGRWPRSLAKAAGGKDLAVPLDGLIARPEQIVAVVELAHRHVTGGGERTAAHERSPTAAT